MIHTIPVPRINANEDEVLLVELLVGIGDRVESGDVVCVVESSKAAQDVLAEQAGFVRRIDAEVGESVAVGARLFLLSDEPAEAIDPAGPAAAESSSASPTRTRSTAKQRLRAKRAARATARAARKPAAPAASITPVEEIEWLQEIRAAVRAKLGDDTPPPRTFESAPTPGASDGVFAKGPCEWGQGARIVARRLYLGRNVKLGDRAFIRADTVYLGSEVRVGADCSLVSGEILIDDGVLFATNALVDLSGGQHPDSGLLVGAASLICANTYLNTCRRVLLERECAVSPGAMLFTHSFWQSVLEGYRTAFEPIRVCENAWIGAGCQVLPGITVGAGAVAVSNSTLIDDVPPECLVAGVPAKVVRRGIRRTLPPGEKLAIVKRLLTELAELLRFKGCAVDSSADELRLDVSRPDIETRAIVIATADSTAKSLPEHSVVLSLGANVSPADGTTVFDLDQRTLAGPEDRLVFEVRNYLRRQGIRFAPHAWDTDYRRGL